MVLFQISGENRQIITHAKQLLERNQHEVLALKKQKMEFDKIRLQLDSDTSLKKQYFKNKVGVYAEFGHEGIEDIDNVLKATYLNNGFFELHQFSFKNNINNKENDKKSILLSIKGEKQLEKP